MNKKYIVPAIRVKKVEMKNSLNIGISEGEGEADAPQRERRGGWGNLWSGNEE